MGRHRGVLVPTRSLHGIYGEESVKIIPKSLGGCPKTFVLPGPGGNLQVPFSGLILRARRRRVRLRSSHIWGLFLLLTSLGFFFFLANWCRLTVSSCVCTQGSYKHVLQNISCLGEEMVQGLSWSILNPGLLLSALHCILAPLKDFK